MNKFLYNIQKYSNIAISYVLMVIAFFLTLYQQVAITAIVVLAFIWLFSGNWKLISNLFQRDQLPLLFLLVYWLLHLFSLIYSSNLQQGFFDIQQKLSFLLFPLVFATSAKVIFPNFRKVLIGFVAGLSISGIYSLLKATSLSFTSRFGVPVFYTSPIEAPWENYFLYSRFSEPHHPTYYSMSLAMGIAILFWMIKNRARNKRVQLLIPIIIISFFSILALLLSSKAGLLSVLLVLVAGILWLLMKKVVGIIRLVLVFSLLVLFIQVGLHNARFSLLLESIGVIESKEMFEEHEDERNEQGPFVRLKIWQSVPLIVGKNWIFGFGVGDAKDELVKGYEKLGIVYAHSNNYNAHNQYLETFAATGVVGLLVLLSMLALSFYKSFASRAILPTMFLFIIPLNMLFESIFERVSGVMFFALFYALFALITKLTKS